jgi:hypothetical protein
MDASFGPIVPILRMYDVAATNRFYLDYLGCALDWEFGGGDGPIYMQVSRGDLKLHLSSNHGDCTPGGAVFVETRGVDALHAELAKKGYPYMNPGIEPGPANGREMGLIDPASNRLLFWERPAVS